MADGHGRFPFGRSMSRSALHIPPRRSQQRTFPLIEQGLTSVDQTVRIAYIFATFPETSFHQREIRALRDHGFDLEIFSLWGGGDSFDGIPVVRFRLWSYLSLAGWIPFWLLGRPRPLLGVVRAYFAHLPPSLKNFCENMVGLAFALSRARLIQRLNPQLIHAAWATMPATAALTVSRLTGIPFSMGAHAYDIYQNGGDWLLSAKLERAQFIHTSTRQAAEDLVEDGAAREKICVVYRGLPALPEWNDASGVHSPLRILTVARMVPKKGYLELIEILRQLFAAGVDFRARLVGNGPLRRSVERLIRRSRLSEQIEVFSPVGRDIVGFYQWSDFFMFTGKVAPDGDRDGIPNVIPEAMAFGIPVLTTTVGGIPEVIRDHENGRLLSLGEPVGWVRAVKELADDRHAYAELRSNGRSWVEENWNLGKHIGHLVERLRRAALRASVVSDK